MEETDLSDVLAEFNANSSRPLKQTLAYLTAILLTRRLLTSWQVEQLLQSKSKGFFWDEYRIMYFLSSAENSSRYSARDMKRNRLVTLRICYQPESIFRFASSNYVIKEDE